MSHEQDLKPAKEQLLQALEQLAGMPNATPEKLAMFALAQACRLTGSQQGFVLARPRGGEQFTALALMYNGCHVATPASPFCLKSRGLWGEAARTRKPLVVNDYAAPHEAKNGVPEGHFALYRFLVTPVVQGQEALLLLAVANKESEYDAANVRSLQILGNCLWPQLERRALEEELARVRAAANTTHQGKSDLLPRLGRGMRNRLNGLFGMLQFLRESPLSFEQREFVDHALTSAQGLLDISDDILDCARIEAEAAFLGDEVFEPQRLLESVCELFAQQAAAKGLFLRTHAPPTLFYGDAAKLRQILASLLDNALAATSEGGVELRVEAAPNEDVATFAVVDTGAGIAAELLPTLFESAAVFERMSPGSEHLGLGLIIAKHVLTQMGGELRARNNPGGGATFELRAPLRQLAPALAALAGKTALVVAHSAGLRSRIAQIIQASEMQVIKAWDGLYALQMFGEHDVDLVLLEIGMPQVDALATTAEIRKKRNYGKKSFVPIIGLASDAAAARKICLDAGMNDCLDKQVAPEALFQAIADRL